MKFCKKFSRLSVVTRPMLPLGRLTVNVDHKTIYTWIKARKGKCKIKTQGEIQPLLFLRVLKTRNLWNVSVLRQVLHQYLKRNARQGNKKMSRDTKEQNNFLYFFTDMIVFDSSWNKKKCFHDIACWRQSRRIFMEKVYTIKGSISVKEMLRKTPGNLDNTHTEIDRAARKLSITLPSFE